MSTSRETISVGLLKNYIQNGFNILISGLAGTGKTQMLLQACSELEMTVKYYETPTLDPFTDLVGVPVPNRETKTIEYYRPHDIDEAEVIFFDEINRADEKTLNTLFEIIQFKTINGEPLPKLKVVVAAMNPDDGDYTVDKLDVALMDRFDFYLTAIPRINVAYFTEKFGREVAMAAANWWNTTHNSYTEARARSNNDAVYISPRRMEKIVAAFTKIPQRSTITNSMPPGAVVDVARLYNELKEALEKPEVTSEEADEVDSVDDMTAEDLLNFNATEIRRPSTAKLVKEYFASNPDQETYRKRFINNLPMALSKSISAERMYELYGDFIVDFTASQVSILTKDWSSKRRSEFHERLAAARTAKYGS